MNDASDDKAKKVADLPAHKGASREDSRLGRRYRRLLRAYPPEYRRDRGEELLDTLLAAAGPTRRRPTARERVNLIRYGLRCRLGRPGSTVIVVIAGLAAILGGFLGAAGGARASWQAARPLPDNAACVAIARTVLPAASSPEVGRRDELFFYDDPTDAWTALVGADDYSPGRVRERMQSPEDHLALIAPMEARLLEAGWQVTAPRYNEANTWPGARLSAYRDELAIHITVSDATNAPSAAPGMVTIVDLDIVRDDPWWVLPASTIGALFGAFAGWLLTGWVSRRTHARHAAVQAGVALLAVGAFVGMLPALALTILSMAFSITEPTPGPDSPMLWIGLVYLGRLPAVLGVVSALTAIGLAGLPRRLWPATSPTRV